MSLPFLTNLCFVLLLLMEDLFASPSSQLSDLAKTTSLHISLQLESNDLRHMVPFPTSDTSDLCSETPNLPSPTLDSTLSAAGSNLVSELLVTLKELYNQKIKQLSTDSPSPLDEEIRLDSQLTVKSEVVDAQDEPFIKTEPVGPEELQQPAAETAAPFGTENCQVKLEKLEAAETFTLGTPTLPSSLLPTTGLSPPSLPPTTPMCPLTTLPTSPLTLPITGNLAHQNPTLPAFYLFKQQQYPLLEHYLSTTTFPSSDHSKLQDLWFSCHYEHYKQLRGISELTPSHKYRVRRNHPLPATLSSVKFKTNNCFDKVVRARLDEVFGKTPYVKPSQMKELARETGLDKNQIKNYFKNKRSRTK